MLAGKRNEPGEHAYFTREIAGRLGPGVTYVGEADARRKRELFAAARALIFPIQWEEPLGMVMIEALACGTPVVALRRGSVPEVISHGRTGLIVDHPQQLAQALLVAETLDPHRCRAEACARFDLPVMAAGYERLYREVTDRHHPAPGSPAAHPVA